MSQAYQMPPSGTDFVHTFLKGVLPDALDALLTCFAGASAPAGAVPYQLWLDTSANVLKIFNSSGTDWITIASLNGNLVVPIQSPITASLSATTTIKLGMSPRLSTCVALAMICDTASTSSIGNEWQYTLRRYPNGAPGSPVNLFSGTIGTNTALGVAGGAHEFVAHAAVLCVPNLNVVATAYDEFELVMTKVGAATTLTNFQAMLHVI
jgi:hypothetical protein